MTHIFISYSRKDEAFARRLAASLSNLGVEVWIDVEDIPPGMKWSSAIQAGLDRCDAMLVIISPGSSASTNVEDEWQYFLDHKKPVIPILWQPTKVHFQLSRLQYIDFHQRDFDAAFQQLTAFLASQSLLPAAPVQGPAPMTPPRPVDTPAYGAVPSAVPPATQPVPRSGSRGTIMAAVAALIIVAGIMLVLVLTSLNDGDSDQGTVATEDLDEPAFTQEPAAPLATEDVSEAESSTPVELTRTFRAQNPGGDLMTIGLPETWVAEDQSNTETAINVSVANSAAVLQSITEDFTQIRFLTGDEIVLTITATYPGMGGVDEPLQTPVEIIQGMGMETAEGNVLGAIETFELNGVQGAYIDGTRTEADVTYGLLVAAVTLENNAMIITLGITGGTDISQYEAVVKAITASAIITPAD